MRFWKITGQATLLPTLDERTAFEPNLLEGVHGSPCHWPEDWGNHRVQRFLGQRRQANWFLFATVKKKNFPNSEVAKTKKQGISCEVTQFPVRNPSVNTFHKCDDPVEVVGDSFGYYKHKPMLLDMDTKFQAWVAGFELSSQSWNEHPNGQCSAMNPSSLKT